MKYRMRRQRGPDFARSCKIVLPVIFVVMVGCLASLARCDEFEPKIFVPYEDLAKLIDPADKAVLMDRGRFEELLARLGAVSAGDYVVVAIDFAEFHGQFGADLPDRSRD